MQKPVVGDEFWEKRCADNGHHGKKREGKKKMCTEMRRRQHRRHSEVGEIEAGRTTARQEQNWALCRDSNCTPGTKLGFMQE